MKYEIKHLPLALFSLMFGKVLFSSVSSLQDIAALAVVGAIAAFYEFKSNEKKQQKLESELEKQAKDIADIKSGTEKRLSELNTHLSSLKLSNTVKMSNGFGR